MVTAEVVVVFNKLPAVGSKLRAEVERRVQQQAEASESDMEKNIVAFGLIESGAMLESTEARQTGEFEWKVGPTAVGEDGYPYPVIQNFGGVHIPASPYGSLTAEKARGEYPRRFDGIGGAIV